MKNVALSFTFDRLTSNIVEINGAKLKSGIAFDDFFNSFLTAERFSISDSKYNELALLNFIASSKHNDRWSLESPDKTSNVFFIAKTNQKYIYVNLLQDDAQKNDIDYLTGVNSRNYLFKKIREEIDKGNNEDAYVLMIDLDNFKQINDNYGHIIGDMCLQTIAEKLEAIFKDDIFGRYGGDEFAAFVKHASPEKIKSLIQEVLNVRFQYEKSSSKKRLVTCSIGCSKPVGDRNDIYVLISEADNALYLSKENGKNRGSIFQSNNIEDNKKHSVLDVLRKNRRTHSSDLFDEEIRKKKRRSYFVLGALLITSLGAIGGVDVFFFFQSNNQAHEIATTLASEQSSNVYAEILNRVDSSFSNLKSASNVISSLSTTVEGNGKEQVYEMLNYLNDNSLIEHPGILLSNGDVFYNDGQVFNITNSTLSKELIIEQKPCVKQVSFLNMGDQIIFGYPMNLTINAGQTSTATISGVLSIYDSKQFSNLVFSDFLGGEAYIALTARNGNKVCENDATNFDYFDEYHNLLNEFKVNGDFKDSQIFEDCLKDEDERLVYFNLTDKSGSSTGYYFFFGAPLDRTASNQYISDWKIVIAIPYSLVLGYFSGLQNLSIISFNVLSAFFIAFFIGIYFFLTHIRVKNLIVSCTDSLTKTINEQRFFNDATSIFSMSVTNNNYIVYANVQKFKYFNGKYGTFTANFLLMKIADSFGKSLSLHELVTREYADHFILLLKANDDKGCEEKLRKILETASKACATSEEDNIHFCCGVYHPLKQNESILLATDRAKKVCEEMPNVEKETDDAIAFFDSQMLEKSELEVYIEESQEPALALGRFQVYYQGKYNLNENRFNACEALVRWKDDRRGFINTQTFINLFEKNGFIIKLDLYVFEQVLKDIKTRMKEGKEIIPVSINISRRHFENEDFFKPYEDKIKEYDIPGQYLEFEITESIVLDNQKNLTAAIKKIHSLGCSVSIDDFGSGYSNLSMLNRIDFDILKMDRNLLFGKNGFDDYSKNIIKTVVALNKNLGKRVVCEGVEHKEESDFLREVGCDWIQGYYYAKPLPKNDFLKLLGEDESNK